MGQGDAKLGEYAAGIDDGICVKVANSGFFSSLWAYGSIVLSRSTTDTRGTVKPRARPARMLAICSSK